MTKHNQTENKSRQTRTRKPYVKPAFEREQIFETMALSCGKVQSTQSSCHNHRNAS
ncbi:MAG TPA: hypothetical protein VIX59_21185 [Candidatus Binataceae bacterium]